MKLNYNKFKMVFKKKEATEQTSNDKKEEKTKVNVNKKIKKTKIGSDWNEKCRLISLSTPQSRGPMTNKKFKYKYQIQIKYKDSNSKIRSKSIKFGKEDKKDYVDHHDKD